MKIYVSHSTGFNYKDELYKPLQQSIQYIDFYFPHEFHSEATNTRNIIENVDYVLAEVSYPSTGQGIELAWAHDAAVSIIGIHKTDAVISSALKLICSKIYAYEDVGEFVRDFFKVSA
ncbi:MAG TPA: hypothetical protein VGV92_09425 [Gammaproteobacteria bacterium]|nr:hypothetical protein [Gammaproteobacteria bacterium]